MYVYTRRMHIRLIAIDFIKVEDHARVVRNFELLIQKLVITSFVINHATFENFLLHLFDGGHVDVCFTMPIFIACTHRHARMVNFPG